MKGTRPDGGDDARGRVLVVDDQPSFRRLLARVMSDDGFAVDEARDGREALDNARGGGYDLVLSDVSMPGIDGMGLLEALAREAPETVVVLITAYGSLPDAVEAMRLGAFDYLAKPLDDPEDLRLLAARAMAERRRRQGSPEGPVQAGSLIYEHPSMAAVAEAAVRVAATDATVLITGESGTGKELVARLLHERSPRASGAFVAVNCAALADGLLDSELFGHERGAFTGADRQRAGRFEAAHGGTLFLDEIGETPPALQSKLLRVLQERRFERVGGNRSVDVDVRIVTATHRDLAAEVRAGRFREDLYYRLAVVPLTLPPLRERGRDVVVLARHFAAALARKHHRAAPRLAADAEDALLGHDWPGNARELQNTIERAVILSRGEVLTRADLWLPGDPARGVSGGGESLPLNLKALERDAIQRALDQTEGNRRAAADLLGIGLRTLHYKLNEYDLR
ncbi:MAG: sigma-54-dependent Fis family transcriptional regulator [Deltaproteobacteria bacterium]|nr:sigma-54-dependent Fis family transcriptional regulator [Deltaproteobacteria bacterium]